MRNAIFVIALFAAGTASAQAPVRDDKPVARQQVDTAREQRARSLAIRLGQIQLDALIDEIVSGNPRPGRAASGQLASR